MIKAYDAYDATSKYHADILSSDRIEKCLNAVSTFIVDAIDEGKYRVSLNTNEVSINHYFSSKEAAMIFLRKIKSKLEDFGYECGIAEYENTYPYLEISWLKPNPPKC